MAGTALVPFRWPPAWTDPKLISLFENGPINCLIVSGAPAGVVDAAGKAGLTVVEWGSLGAAPLDKVDWNITAPRIAITDLVWPRVALAASGGRGQVQSGPTGAPWIDSNAWVARLAMARAPAKQIWLGFEPPKGELPPDEGAYRVAIADAAAANARWMVNLDEKLGQALASGNADATKTWRSILATLAFFEKQSAWREYVPQGPLAIISTFAGNDEFMGKEMLNLAARQQLLYRIVDRSRMRSADLTGLRAALWLDKDPPAADIVAKLAAFARGGGLLIVPVTAGSLFRGERVLDCPVAGYELRAFGRGTVAAATREWGDPYFLALDTHNLVSRRYDPIRMFNGSSCWVHYSAAPAGKDSLIQLVRFAGSRNSRGGREAGDLTVRIPARHRSVILYTLDAAPAPLQPVTENSQVEYHLPQFSGYAALEVKA
ncbi:MAG TPA: hypothetical protein VE959_25130 [Bryobacteraceae bacterium]|nr:hypothetical protein [Bryobacteraceae bacterium]